MLKRLGKLEKTLEESEARRNRRKEVGMEGEENGVMKESSGRED